jgi:cellulose synthase/poly-beta-1,6-N-acetylglucosamine synthase-like glycosyltransferase
MTDFYNILVYILAYIGFFASSFYLVSLLTYYRKKKLDATSTKRKVSIIIPAYNEERSIIRTIKSALSIDYPKENLEIIVVDDGSRDRTYSLAKQIASKNSNIRVFTKKNGGKGSALNLGIKHARGEIIVSMDADSFVNPDALQKMAAFFDNPKVMAVTPSMGVYKPRTFWQRIQHIEYYMGVFLRKSFATVNAIHITPGAFSAYRKSFFVKYNGYDEHNITEDLEIALRIQSKHYIIENSPHSVVYTLAPSTFKPLLIQRKRWYTGLIKNLWAYRHLFGFKKGPLGTLVLPVAVSTVILSVILTVYVVLRAISHLRDELLSLASINFRFQDSFELNSFVLKTFAYQLLSSPTFLISCLFILLLIVYMLFSRKQMKYTESIKVNFVIFIFFYSLLFAFWWIVSAVYVAFNKKVVWREENGRSK